MPRLDIFTQPAEPKSLASTLATGLGTGFGGALQQLAQNKIAAMQKQQVAAQQAPFWKALLGPTVPDEFVMGIVNSEPGVQKAILDRLEGASIGGQQAAQPAAEAGQQAGMPEAATGPRIGASPIERRHRETLKQQAHLQTLNNWGKYSDKIETSARPARQLINLATEAKELLKTGKAITGKWAAITPEQLQTPEGQRLMTKLMEIVTLKAQTGKGVPSLGRLKLEERAKAKIWQHPEAIEAIMNDIINDPELTKEAARAQAVEDIETQYGQNIPEDWRGQLKKRTKELLGQTNELQTLGATADEISQLNDSALKENAEVELDNGIKLIKKNGRWGKV